MSQSMVTLSAKTHGFKSQTVNACLSVYYNQIYIYLLTIYTCISLKLKSNDDSVSKNKID